MQRSQSDKDKINSQREDKNEKFTPENNIDKEILDDKQVLIGENNNLESDSAVGKDKVNKNEQEL